MPFEGRLIGSDPQGMAPLRHWSDQQVAGVEAVMAAAWRDWTLAWNLAARARQGGAGLVRASRVEAWMERGQPDWQALHGAEEGERRAWVAFESAVPAVPPAQLLCEALFGAPADGELAAEVGQAAWRHLLESIGHAAGIALGADGHSAGAGPAGDDCGPWSGTLELELPLSGSVLRLLLNGPCVADMTPPQASPAAVPAAALQPLGPTLARQRLRLKAALAPAELSLGSLQRLAVGDVVVLPHSLRDALLVIGADGVELCRAHLGQQLGYRALELLPRTPEIDLIPAASSTAV